MWLEQLCFWIPVLVGIIFTISEKTFQSWEFTNWNSLAEEAVNPIVEKWGSEERFDLIILDNSLHLPPSVIWTPENPPQHIGYFSWIFTKVITTFPQLWSIMNTTFALATIVVIFVACLGAIIYQLQLKKQAAEKSYFISLVQFLKKEAATSDYEHKLVLEHLDRIMSTKEAQISEAMMLLMFEQEKIGKMKTELTAKEEKIQDLTSALGDLGIENAKAEDKSARQATTIHQLRANLAEIETKKKNSEERSKLLESDMATAAAKADSTIHFLKADAEHLLVLIAGQWSQLDDARTTIDANNEKVADLALELSKHTEEISTINVSLDSPSYWIEEIKKSATGLQSKVVQRDATIMRLKSKVADDEKEIKLLQAANKESEAQALKQKSKLKDENLQTIRTKEDLESELAKVRKENTAAISQVSKGQKEVQKLKREVDEQSKKLSEGDKLTSNTCKEKAEIAARLAEALERIAEEGINIRKKDEKYRLLESEMTEAKRDFQNILAKEKNRLQFDEQQLKSGLLDECNAKMTALKAKYNGIAEDAGTRVKVLEEENIRLGHERDAQIAVLNTEHGNIVQKITSKFAGELTTVENQNRRLKTDKEDVAKELASMTKALGKGEAGDKDKSPGPDQMAAKIIGELQASLAAAGREAQEWRTEAYIAIVRKMPPSERGMTLFNVDSRNFTGSHQVSLPPNSLSSLPADRVDHVNIIPNFRRPNPPTSLPPRSPLSSLPTPSHAANPAPGQSNADFGLPSSPHTFAGLNPAASEFRATKNTRMI